MVKTTFLPAVVTAILLALPALAEDTPAVPPGATVDRTSKPLLGYTLTGPAGATDFDAADRLAIANVLYAYSFFYDNAQADPWFALFTDDCTFVAGVPGEGALSFTGEGFRTFWRARMKDFATSGQKRRHLMPNILVLEQTPTTAHITVQGLLTNTTEGTAFTAVGSLNYEGWLVKQDGVWKIDRWHDFPDGPV
ncbi:nuclear transport factor 2 family protein [Chachezhania sediminis]|uniref:nuclear transport factor 2 family protein n=1 Tax=Chachezhania sediminis TaxID=2599291 RepID=UPI00131C2D37|nr:nuclear transport factor 2 family protein [Chachezhania sediminis]